MQKRTFAARQPLTAENGNISQIANHAHAIPSHRQVSTIEQEDDQGQGH